MMAWRCSGASNRDLVQNLALAKIITNPRVEQAMLATDRRHYARSQPYQDSPQGIGYGATISAPHMHAHALDQLEPYLQPGMRALDVGSGSGYLTSCMAEMVGKEGKVVGIEHIPELVDLSTENVRKARPEFLDEGRVEFVVGDGRKGYPKEAPYDCIHVGAAAHETPKDLIEQLKAPGRMFIPVGASLGQSIYLVDKDRDGKVTKKELMGVMVRIHACFPAKTNGY
ncbi:uncharacterized protein VTP21DRAFT_3584 [Calcarisporiella thermophila]|uniref:uncharacterized protein n=1 Tax=Calcarisporiella thermophila TaxID=911321 RepID=UPI0037429F15